MSVTLSTKRDYSKIIQTDPAIEIRSREKSHELGARVIDVFDESPYHYVPINNGRVIFTTDKDFQASSPDWYDLCKDLKLPEGSIIATENYGHTTNIELVERATILNPGIDTNIANPQFNSIDDGAKRQIDGVIVASDFKDGNYAIAVRGADCPAIVGSAEIDGKLYYFGVHTGRRGTLCGISATLLDKLKQIGEIKPGSVEMIVGPGGMSQEIPLKLLRSESKHHINNRGWIPDDDSVLAVAAIERAFSHISDKPINDSEVFEGRVIYDNPLDVTRRLKMEFDGLLSKNGFTVLAFNTITNPRMHSHRAMGGLVTDELKEVSQHNKLARNALVITPKVR